MIKFIIFLKYIKIITKSIYLLLNDKVNKNTVYSIKKLEGQWCLAI